MLEQMFVEWVKNHRNEIKALAEILRMDEKGKVELVEKFKAWEIAKENWHLAFAETDGGGE